MTSVASNPHPSDPHSVADHLPPRSSKSLLASTWQVLDQPPPPSLREILGAYRSRGDGDREMLMAMLNAKSAEDQRIASVASLHRSMLEYYQVSPRQPPEAPYTPEPNPAVPTYQNGAYQFQGPPAPAPQFTHYPKDTSSQRSAHAHSQKRIRTSESPPSTYRSIPPTSYTPSPPPGPSSPYSSRSVSVDQSPRSRDAMAIGSLLTVGVRPQPRDGVDDSLQNDSVLEERSQLRR